MSGPKGFYPAGPTPRAMTDGGPGTADLPTTGEPPTTAVASDGDAPDLSASSAAFAALGSEVRLAVLTTLREAADAGAGPLAFSALFEAAPADTTAGFAYHLRQLTDRFVRETDDGYVLTDAGRRVARALATDAYASSPTLPETELGADCPHCGAEALVARSADGTSSVACTACERRVLSLPVPPGADSHAPESMPAAFERHHRHRLAAFADGVCPDCGGRVTGEVRPSAVGAIGDGSRIDGTTQGPAPAVTGSPPDPATGSPPAAATGTPTDAAAESTGTDRVAIERVCQACGASVAAPVPLFLLNHPTVVSFYDDHGVDLRERSLWTVGPEWAAGVASRDPWAIRVASELDGERLRLLVGEDLSVVDAERRAS